MALSEQFLWGKVGQTTREVVTKLTNRQIRFQKCLGEAMSRELIENLWQLQAEDYSIVRGEHGKPYIEGVPAVYYNLSHSGDYIVCALSDREVGVDIQQMGKEKPHLAERFFHPNEVLKLKQLTSEERTLLFYRYWSAKESYLKYIGTGLSGSLSSFEIVFDGDAVWVEREGSLDYPSLWELEIDPAYQCCLCAESQESPELYSFYFQEP